jgi:hypothetical protein
VRGQYELYGAKRLGAGEDFVLRGIAAWNQMINARQLFERSGSLLVEYRQSLITAAVTGEFDATAASGREMPE